MRWDSLGSGPARTTQDPHHSGVESSRARCSRHRCGGGGRRAGKSGSRTVRWRVLGGSAGRDLLEEEDRPRGVKDNETVDGHHPESDRELAVVFNESRCRRPPVPQTPFRGRHLGETSVNATWTLPPPAGHARYQVRIQQLKQYLAIFQRSS